MHHLQKMRRTIVVLADAGAPEIAQDHAIRIAMRPLISLIHAINIEPDPRQRTALLNELRNALVIPADAPLN